MLHICNRPEGNGIGYQSPALVKLLEQQERSADRPDPFHAIYRRFARAAVGPQISPVACERTGGTHRRFVTHEPLAWLRLVGAKALVFAGPDARHRRGAPGGAGLPIPPLASFRFLTALGSPVLRPACCGDVRWGCSARTSSRCSPSRWCSA
jgi:hypothetical protein